MKLLLYIGLLIPGILCSQSSTSQLDSIAVQVQNQITEIIKYKEHKINIIKSQINIIRKLRRNIEVKKNIVISQYSKSEFLDKLLIQDSFFLKPEDYNPNNLIIKPDGSKNK